MAVMTTTSHTDAQKHLECLDVLKRTAVTIHMVEM